MAEATAILNEIRATSTGEDAYLAWLQDRHDQAIEQLDGVHFDIPPAAAHHPGVLARGSSSGAAYYTGPSEDLTRPGPDLVAAGRPGSDGPFADLDRAVHRLPRGRARPPPADRRGQDGRGQAVAVRASRASSAATARAGPCTPSASRTSWAGSPSPGTRLGMLGGSAFRAARVVIDIGVHLDLPLPDGSRWTLRAGLRGAAHGAATASRTGSTPRWSATSAGRPRPSPTSSASGPGWRPGPRRCAARAST